MRRSLLPVVWLLACLVPTAGEARRSKTVWKTDGRGVLMVIAKAPQKARGWKNPYDGQSGAVRAGQKLFSRDCAECHGEDARGLGRAANLRAPLVQNATPGELAWFLRNGNLARGMPPWAGIPEQRRWQIIAYLKSLGPGPLSPGAAQ